MISGAVMEACSRRLGLQRGNSVSRAVFLLKGQACRGVLPHEDLPDQKCRQLGYRRCWSRQDSTHGHSQSRNCYFELYWVWHWEPMKHVAKGRRDVFVSAITDNQMGSTVQNHLKSTDDLWRDTVQLLLPDSSAYCDISITGSETGRAIKKEKMK